jgi:polyisoprenyl-phosphate glycosyltransferase
MDEAPDDLNTSSASKFEKNSRISLIIPVFNENADTLEILEKTLLDFFDKSKDIVFEVILVDDSTLMETRAATRMICIKNAWKGIYFTRNFGKEAALRAGLEKSTGEASIILDSDLQDPIELIPQMINLWKSTGVPVVLAKRIDRTSDSLLKRNLSGIFYRVINRLADIEIPINVGDFRLMDREVVKSVLLLDERNIFQKGIFAWVGYPFDVIEYIRPPRSSGDTKFSYRRLFKIATDGIVSFSSFPLRAWSYMGFAIAGISLGYLFVVIALKILGFIQIPGYTSLLVLISGSLSLNLICFGVFGEYLSRMFMEVKQRPHYILYEEIN